MPILEIIKQTLAALWPPSCAASSRCSHRVGHHFGHPARRLGIGFSIDQREHLKTIGTDIAICFGGKTAMPPAGTPRAVTSSSTSATPSPSSSSPRWSRPSPRRSAPPFRKSASGTPPAVPSARLAPVPGLPLAHRRAGPPDVLRRRGHRRSRRPARRRIQRQLFPGKPPSVRPSPSKATRTPSSAFSATRNRTAATAPARTTPALRSLLRHGAGLPADQPGFVTGTVNNIVVQPISAAVHVAALRQVREVIANRHHFDPPTSTPSGSGTRWKAPSSLTTSSVP